MKIKNIKEYLNFVYPPHSAEIWDKIGIQTGDELQNVKNIIVALDLTENVVKYSLANNVNLVILHHNPWFEKNLTSEQKNLKNIFIRENICVFVIHTNFDNAQANGMKAVMKNLLKLDKIYEFDEHTNFGFIWIEATNKNIDEIALKIKKLPFSTPFYYYGNSKASIKKVAFLPGGGKDFVYLAIRKKVDLFITGDLNWHSKLLANEEHLNLLEISHSVENVFCQQIQKILLRERFQSVIFNSVILDSKKMF